MKHKSGDVVNLKQGAAPLAFEREGVIVIGIIGDGVYLGKADTRRVVAFTDDDIIEPSVPKAKAGMRYRVKFDVARERQAWNYFGTPDGRLMSMVAGVPYIYNPAYYESEEEAACQDSR